MGRSTRLGVEEVCFIFVSHFIHLFYCCFTGLFHVYFKYLFYSFVLFVICCIITEIIMLCKESVFVYCLLLYVD